MINDWGKCLKMYTKNQFCFSFSFQIVSKSHTIFVFWIQISLWFSTFFIFFPFSLFFWGFSVLTFFWGGGVKTGGVLWHISITFHKREARNCFNHCSTRSVDSQQADCEGICSEWSWVKHKIHKQPGATHHYHICSACEQLGVLGIRELQLLPKSLPLIYFFYYCNQNIESC